MSLDRNFIEAGLYGLLIGDALGVPYEFHESSSIPPEHLIDFQPPADFYRSHRGVAPGTWSDDGSQALCLFESLLEHPELDLIDFSSRLLNWHDYGHLQAGGRVFDVGIQTSRAFGRLKAGVPPDQSGPNDEKDNGNGSLMRVLPVALLHDPERHSISQLIDKAMRQSLPTHGHPRSQLCCAQLVLVANALRDGLDEDTAWERAAEELSRFAAGNDGARDTESYSSDLVAECNTVLVPDPGYLPAGSGYVLDNLWSARWALRRPGYEAVVKAAVRLGNDTDTTAAISGGLAGVRGGLAAIPARWIDGLIDTMLMVDLIGSIQGPPTRR